MKYRLLLVSSVLTLGWSSVAHASTEPSEPVASSPAQPTSEGPAEVEPKRERAASWLDYKRGPAFEVNVLWPFFPGGIVDLKVVIPVLRRDYANWRGELITGLHSDFEWRFIRDDRDNYGQVAFLGVKLGWRQFLAYGLHVDLTVNAGWRHERDNPHATGTINSFQGRFWGFAGYQHEFTRRVYANLRGGLGVHLWRTDELAHRERQFAGGADLNLGLRF
ncbi:MAG: hypothetical protein ACRBN8_14115 [Nannocystales bacterium]